MKKNKLVIKIIAMMLVFSFVVGISLIHIDKSKANEIEESSVVECEENDLDGIQMTESLKEYYDNMSDMTEEEFYDVFSSETYENELENLYGTNITREDMGDSSNNSQDITNEISEDDINNIAEQVERKMPGAIKEKLGMTLEKIKQVVKKATLYVAGQVAFYGVALTICMIFPDWPTQLVKAALELSVVLVKSWNTHRNRTA